MTLETGRSVCIKTCCALLATPWFKRQVIKFGSENSVARGAGSAAARALRLFFGIFELMTTPCRRVDWPLQTRSLYTLGMLGITKAAVLGGTVSQ